MNHIKNPIYYLIASGAVCVPILFFFMPYKKQPVSVEKKKILILSSAGGGGHNTVAQALTNYLSPCHAVETIGIFEKILGNSDPISWITQGGLNGEELYNQIAYERWFTLLHVMHKLGRWYFNFHADYINTLLIDYLKTEKPDLVISVVPVVSQILLRATRKLDIPLLLVTTDFDVTTFLDRLEVVPQDKFHLTLPYSIPSMHKLALEKGVHPDQIYVTGIPLRPDFFKRQDIPYIKKKYSIADNKPTILITLGSLGSRETYLIAQQLKKLKRPAHLIFCLGHNDSLKRRIKNIQFPHDISITVLGYTNDMAGLMATSDMIIAKSGSVTVYEALHMKLPMILDATSTILQWERLNHDFIYQNQCGQSLRKIRSTSPVINELLECPKKLDGYQYGLSHITTENAGKKILELVNTIVENNGIH